MRLAKLSLFASFLYVGLAMAQPAPAPTAAATQNAPGMFAVAAAKSTVTFHVVHPLHKVEGVSKAIEGRARITPDGKAQVMVMIAADSFDSGNVNRDAKVKEIIEVIKYPKIVIKASADGITPPASLPATVEKTFKAQISFHGIDKNVEMPVKLVFEADGSIRAQGQIKLSLDELKVERPSLMFKKIEDTLVVDANVVFNKS